MTEAELTEQLREAIVLDGPDAWRTNGYLQDAQNAGLPLPAALKRAAEVSQEVSNNSILYQNIRARIARLAQPARAHLFEQDINQIINAARSLNLSPDFVRNRWIPAELARIAPQPAPPVQPASAPTPPPEAKPEPADVYEELIEPEPTPPTPVPEVLLPEPEPKPIVEYKPVAEPVPAPAPESVFTSIRPVDLPEPPAPIVRSFTATPARVKQGQAVTLEWDVTNLLAVTIDDLGEGLSPKNRGWVKPKKTTDYTLFDANSTPLSTVRVEVIPRDRSGIYGVLFALALLAIIYWFIRNTNSRSTSEPTRRERTSDRAEASETSAVSRQETPPDDAVQTPAEPVPDETETVATDTRPTAQVPVTEPQAQPAEETKPEPEPETVATPAEARQGKYEEAFGDRPFDKVELGTDERGWRRARSKGRWGYVNQNDEWVIEPEYEAVTPFRGNTATAFLNGQLITINRNGEQVRN